MRDDLYKKHITAEPIAARLPYGVVTRLVELIGWKRMELNNFIKFHGVQEANFNSLLRRSWVCKLKPRFVHPDILKTIPNAHVHGIFATKSDLKEKFASKPYAGGNLKIVHGFIGKVSLDECRACIEIM